MQPLLLLLDFAVVAALTWLTNWLTLMPLRRDSSLHWTERARRLYPARMAAAAATWVIPVDFALAQSLLWPKSTPHWLLAASTGWIGAISATWFFDR